MRSLKQFAAIGLIALLAVVMIACGGSDAPEPAATTAAPATATPAPDTPTPRPASTIAPTATPRPTATAAPTATATSRPAATATPIPTAMPEPTATPQPTATPRPTSEPVADALAPLGDNLLWVAHYDNATRRISVYDPSGAFTVDALPVPTGLSLDDSDSLPVITHLIQDEIYFVNVSRAQQLVLGDQIINLVAGVNFLTR